MGPTTRLPIRYATQLGMLFLVLFLDLPRAHAAPLVTVETGQDCPSQADVENEVQLWSLPESTPTSTTWRAVIDHPTTRSARMRLYASDGTLALERRIQSDDCAALAKAFAIILETHFLDLGLVLPRTDTAEAPPKSEPAPESPPKGKPKPVPPEPAATRSTRARIALGIGAQWATPEPGLTAAARALLGLSWKQRWALDLALNLALPQEQDGAFNNDRVESQAISATLALAHRWALADTGWLEPHVGAGARVTQLNAPQIAGNDQLSARILSELGLATGVQIGPNWSPRLDVVGQLLLDRDRYTILPYGTVGQGPRMVVFVSLGVELGGL